MKLLNTIRHLGFVVGAVVAAPLPGLAGSAGTNGITASAADGVPFELRGILELDGRLEFSVREVESGNSFWVGLGREFRGLHVMEYDTAEKTLVCNYRGEAVTLQLAKDDGIPLNILENPDLADVVIHAGDIDPSLSGQQSLTALKSKLRFSVGTRSSRSASSGTQGSGGIGGNSTRNTGQEPGVAENPVSDVPTQPSLSESELIALEAFEKNYVAVREAPKDVDVVYNVGPR